QRRCLSTLLVSIKQDVPMNRFWIIWRLVMRFILINTICSWRGEWIKLPTLPSDSSAMYANCFLDTIVRLILEPPAESFLPGSVVVVIWRECRKAYRLHPRILKELSFSVVCEDWRSAAAIPY